MAEPSAQTVALPSQISADGWGALHQALFSASSPQLDASAIERPSTSYIQILLACLRAEKPASIVNASPALRAAWDDFGLTKIFPLEQ